MSIRKKTKFYYTYDDISKNFIKVNALIWLKDLPTTYCKKFILSQKPSRACTQQLTKVLLQSDEWYRNSSNTDRYSFIYTNVTKTIFCNQNILTETAPGSHMSYLLKILSKSNDRFLKIFTI